jgi:pyruvate/2-oxoacid:ferredoxin oxidoreductase beta subunit
MRKNFAAWPGYTSTGGALRHLFRCTTGNIQTMFPSLRISAGKRSTFTTIFLTNHFNTMNNTQSKQEKKDWSKILNLDTPEKREQELRRMGYYANAVNEMTEEMKIEEINRRIDENIERMRREGKIL